MSKQKFSFTKGSIFGEIFTGETLHEAINKLPKRLNDWEGINFKHEGKNIFIDRETFDETGWTIEQIIQDRISSSSEDELNQDIQGLFNGKMITF